MKITRETVNQAAQDWEQILIRYLDAETDPDACAGQCGSALRCALAKAFCRHFRIAGNDPQHAQLWVRRTTLEVYPTSDLSVSYRGVLPEEAIFFIRSFDRIGNLNQPATVGEARLALKRSKRNYARAASA